MSVDSSNLQSDKRYVLIDGLASQVVVTLTSGPILISYALSLGMSFSKIGLIVSLTAFAMLFQIPAIYIINRFKNRKAITASSSFISRTAWIILAILPLYFSTNVVLLIFPFFIFFNAGFSAIASCSWNSWMKDLLPPSEVGAFFSKRMKLAMIVGIITNLAAAYFLSHSTFLLAQIPTINYTILFAIAFLSGLVGIFFITKTSNSPLIIGDDSFFSQLLNPIKHENFKRLLIFLFLWNFAMNLAGPFFTVYLLSRLNFSISIVIALTILSQLTSILCFNVWGSITDRFGNKVVLQVVCSLFLMCVFGWTFTTLPEKHALTIPLIITIQIVMGIANSGISLATRNIVIKLSPKYAFTSYLAVSNIIIASSAGIAPLIGGYFVEFFKSRALSLKISWITPNKALAFETLHFQHWDFFFVFSVLFGVFALHRLALVHEEGSVTKKWVFKEFTFGLRQELADFSTFGGIKSLILLNMERKNLFKKNKS